MAEKIIYAMYDDDDVLKDGAKKLVAKGVKVSEVFSPFPIHGIDPIIGVQNTRLGIMAFLYAINSLASGLIWLSNFLNLSILICQDLFQPLASLTSLPIYSLSGYTLYIHGIY